MCGLRPAIDRHHIDGDTTNNDRSNITLACRRCHMVLDGRMDESAARLRALSKTPWRRGQTHCKRGHEFSLENTHIDPTGRRVCRACRREREASY